MRHWFSIFALAFAGLATSGQFLPAKALVARRLSIPERVVASDCIVIGKVIAIEDKPIEVEPSPGAPKVSYKIASIKIAESIHGAKGLTNVRVGFIAPMPVQPIAPGVPNRGGRIARPMMNVTLAVGQQGCFFLSKFGNNDFLLISPLCPVVDKKAADFDKQVRLVKKTVTVIANPVNALKAKEQSDRFAAAAILLEKYSFCPPNRSGKMVRRPIGAEESRLILSELEHADWSKSDDAVVNPLTLFQRLGLQPKDGFHYPRVQPGQDFNQVMRDAAKKWLSEHAGKYRIQQWVEEKK
jgi:hypothetical protein